MKRAQERLLVKVQLSCSRDLSILEMPAPRTAAVGLEDKLCAERVEPEK